jgi:ribonuclease P protein component
MIGCCRTSTITRQIRRIFQANHYWRHYRATRKLQNEIPTSHIFVPNQFTKSDRLRKQPEFDRVYRGDHFAADDVLVIRARPNQLDRLRLGLSVSKKVGNAVERNRWKRRIREAFRLQKADLPCGIDLVVRPKRGATCDAHAIHRSIAKLVERLNKKINR